MSNKIQEHFAGYGLSATKMLLENISLPDAVEKALDKRTSMGVIGDLKKYTQFQAANALEEAAGNPGGMGMGFAMANQVGQAMSQTGQSQPPTGSRPHAAPAAPGPFLLRRPQRQAGRPL